MRVIIKPSDSVKNYIGEQEYMGNMEYVLSPYIISLENNTLLYNVMTCELIELEGEENEEQYLVEHWFKFSKDIEPYTFAKAFKTIYKEMNKAKKIGSIQRFTIMTTMDCNARCNYCYEQGRNRIYMTPETAKETGNFIASNSGAKVHITWFGGEPLLNTNAMTMVSNVMDADGVYFTSSIITNGFLLSKCDIKDINFWRIKEVQITLDGTGELYKKTKRYIYDNEDPLSVVLDGIEKLLNNDIKVNIRLNVTVDNTWDLHSLIDDLCDRFSCYNDFNIYTHSLFGDKNEKTANCEISLRKHLAERGICNNYALASEKLIKNCMADSMNSIVVAPDGKLALCEHFSETEIVGDIRCGIKNQKTVSEWRKEYWIPECKECKLYPQCTKLRKCPVSECTEIWKKRTLYSIESTIKNVYERYRKGISL